MKIKLLNAADTAKELRRLIKVSENIHIAVAWGYNGPLADLLLLHHKKFVAVAFGLDFYHTSPDLIDSLIRVKNTRVVRGGKRTFHPKIYFFTKGEDAEAIIGSANFTHGGLGNNYETSIHLTGRNSDQIFRDIESTVRHYASLGKTVTRDIADVYRQSYRTAPTRRKVRGPFLPDDGSDWTRATSSLIRMNWKDYVLTIRKSPGADVTRRLELLQECRRMLMSTPTFGSLSADQWKFIAGTLGAKQAEIAGLHHFDWGFFGSMSVAGSFSSLILNQNQHLARAVDAIPRQGEVTASHYKTFCDFFVEAFRDASHQGSVPTASRLLAMKRPDCFICVNSQNDVALAKELGFSRTTLNFDRYWEEIIEPIRQSDWYNAQRPVGQNAALWDGRVAMLDVIYYRPPHKAGGGKLSPDD